MTGRASALHADGASSEDRSWGALSSGARMRADGLIDARSDPTRELPPEPLSPGDVAACREALTRSYREAYETLLAHLPPDRRDRLSQLAKESLGAWSLLLCSRGGTALYHGNPLTGAVSPLAALGLRVTLLDLSPERLWLALRLAEHQVRGRVRGVLAGDGPGLPFEDGQFDVVVYDDLAPSRQTLEELGRVCRGELFVTGDNRLGYKRSSGRTWDFRVPSPLEYAGRALRPRRGERTLSGWRTSLRADGFDPARAFALYPDRRDFAQVVALDQPLPRLFVGPNERRNRMKVAAHALGLFPHLAPSYGFLSRRRGLAPGPARLERVLERLSAEIGEPRPEVEHLVATRGNTAVVMTVLAGAAADDPRGRWLLHVPLHQGHRSGLELHHRTLARVRERFPGVPVPEPLLAGEIDGLWLNCERRLYGWASNHLLVDRSMADKILLQMAQHLALLVLEPARPLSDEDYELTAGIWFERTLRTVRDAALRGILERRRQEVRRLLVGRSLPRMLAHGDPRAKHVQVDLSGNVLGYMDWGTIVEPALPGLDLMQRIVHDRKQLLGQHDGEAWRELCDPQRLMPGERAALERYASALGLESRTLPVLAQLYPVFVSATIDRYAPYVPPDWYRRNFGL